MLFIDSGKNNKVNKETGKNIARLILFLKKSVLLAAIMGLWQLLPSVGIVRPSLLPPFSKVFSIWLDMFTTGKILPDILISLERALAGFGIALAVGIPIGIAIGYFKSCSDFLSPLINVCRQIPSMSLFPVFILFFGLGESSKIAIVFWVSVWSVLLNTIDGVRHIDLLLIKAARSMGADNKRILYTVVLPGIVPSMMTGIRLGAGLAITSLIPAEMIGAKAGLGFQVFNLQFNFQIAQMYAVILTIALLGIIINQLLVRLEKRLTFWKQTIEIL